MLETHRPIDPQLHTLKAYQILVKLCVPVCIHFIGACAGGGGGVYQSLIVGNQLAIKSLSTLVGKRLGVGPIWLAWRKESREKTPG